MYAIKVDENNVMRWSEVPDPEPKFDEILLEIHATALNRADLLQRAGKYPPPPGWPEWMGLEAAGVVLGAPAGCRWKPGDKVCALLGGGGYAQKIAVPQNLVLPIPRGLSMVEAASLPEAFATSWLNLHNEANLKRGETIFIQAGASGLGIAAIQTARHMGAIVTTSVGSDEKATFVRQFGTNDVVNRKKEDLSVIFDRHAVDVALDCVGGSALGRNIGKMAIGGRWILISTLGGELAEIPLRLILKRAITLKGSTLRSRSNKQKGQILTDMERELWPAVEAGEIRPVIHTTLPMEKVEEAHAILRNGENTGKVILTIEH